VDRVCRWPRAETININLLPRKLKLRLRPRLDELKMKILRGSISYKLGVVAYVICDFFANA